MLQVSTQVCLELWTAPGFFKLIECWLEDRLDEYRKYTVSLKDTRPVHREVTRSHDYSGVYVLYFKKNSKFYVGSSRNLSRRIDVHLTMMRTGKHYNNELQRSFDKNGKPEILYLITDGEVRARTAEQRLVDLLFKDPYCMNQRQQVEEYRPSTEETRGKLQEAAKNQWQSEEFRKKIQELNKQPENLARRIATGIKLKSDPAYMKKLSDASKEVWKDPEYQAKQKASGSAVWDKEGFRERHREAMKAKWADPEYRARTIRSVSPKRKPVTIDGVTYSHSREAALALGISETGVRRKASKS